MFIHFSDTFRIQDEYGDTIDDLTLNQIKEQSLVEKYGLPHVLNSMALQRQEELDIFFSDAVWIINFFFFFKKNKALF